MPRKGKDNSDNKKKGSTRQEKAGLTLSVSRVEKILKETCPGRHKKKTAPIFLTAIMDKINQEAYQHARNFCKPPKAGKKPSRIKLVHLQQALQDKDFKYYGLCSSVIGGINAAAVKVED